MLYKDLESMNTHQDDDYINYAKSSRRTSKKVLLALFITASVGINCYFMFGGQSAQPKTVALPQGQFAEMFNEWA